MEPTGATRASRVSRLLRSPSALLAAPLVTVALLLVVDEASGPRIRIGGLMVAVPALSAAFLSPGPVLVVALFTMVCVVLAAQENQQLDTENFPVVMATVVLIAAGAVAAAAIRRRRERELAQVRWVASMTQRVLLRPLPRRLGPLTVSSMYLAADEESAIGGDLYAAAAMDGGGARVLIGDVQGKGLGAIEVAGFLLSSFRRASHRRTPLPDLPGYLDRRLREDLADLSDLADGDAADGSLPAGSGRRPAPRTQPRLLEGFVTAVVVDVAGDGTTMEIANCGHPPPLLIRDREVRRLDPAVPALPLGLGDLSTDTQPVDTYELGRGDVLLLYTDGVIEARDGDGRFYPLADRLAAFSQSAPDELLRAISDDLARHVRSRLSDDVAMVAVQRVV